MFVNYTQPGDPCEYWNELVGDYIPALQSVFAITTEMKSKYFEKKDFLIELHIQLNMVFY